MLNSCRAENFPDHHEEYSVNLSLFTHPPSSLPKIEFASTGVELYNLENLNYYYDYC